MKNIIICSGYFIILHIGHVKMFQEAKNFRDENNVVLAIINNDQQQTLKKGSVAVPELERTEIIKSIRFVDRVVLSEDTDLTVCKTLKKIVEYYSFINGDYRFYFVNGGDRTSGNIPEEKICKELGVETVYGVGGDEKANSTTDILRKVTSW